MSLPDSRRVKILLFLLPLFSFLRFITPTVIHCVSDSEDPKRSFWSCQLNRKSTLFQLLGLPRHVFANGSDCPVLGSYQMWFGQKLLKKAKTNSKIMKIWLFLWNPLLVAPKSAISGFLAFLNNFWPKILQKPEMANFCATRSGFHKNSQIFIILLLVLAF